jgi:hypothetical protein
MILYIGGRYLSEDRHRDALEAMLIDFQRPTGWPVKHLIAELKCCWTQEQHIRAPGTH